MWVWLTEKLRDESARVGTLGAVAPKRRVEAVWDVAPPDGLDVFLDRDARGVRELFFGRQPHGRVGATSPPNLNGYLF